MIESFVEISFIIIITVLLSGLMRLLRQPLIIGYILAGIIVSSHGLNIVDKVDSLSTFASLGVALLLFMVGLNLNPQVIRNVGKGALILGLAQVVLTALISAGIALFLGFGMIPSLYIAVALTFSSTIIIMKLLSDKGDLDTLYGQISVGFLLVQDLVAIILLMLVPSVSQGGVSFGSYALNMIVIGLGLLVVLLLISLYILPHLGRVVARSQELLLLASLGWCFLAAVVFYSLGFSLEIGALVAGITLSTSPYKSEISSKLKPLRDFFLFLFFIMLGTQMTFTNISTHATSLIVFSLLVLLGKPIIIFIIMGMLHYTKRTSFLTGMISAQISEFSLILVALGVQLGQLSSEISSLVTLIGIISIAGSTYFILHAEKLYAIFSPLLSVFERSGKKIEDHGHMSDKPADIILFGYNRIGYDLLTAFRKLKKSAMVVDYNPDITTKLSKEGIHCKYGDASDIELLDCLQLGEVKMVVSTIPDVETNIILINKVRQANKNAIILVVSHQIEDAMKLYEIGATYVVMPHFLGGKHTATLIEEYGFDLQKFLKEKIVHVQHLRHRKALGHRHPIYER